MLGEIVPATREHATSMAPNMRVAEMRELMSGAGFDPEEGLLFELERSASAWSWIIDGEVACMFGIISPNMLDAQSYPWFLTTYLVETHARQFARACKTLLPELLERHPRLVGMVDARYGLSILWLEWLGAKIDEPEPWGVAREPWRRFEIGG